MKKLLLLPAILTLISCSMTRPSKSGYRGISSIGHDLTGTYLGAADYGKGHPGPNLPAVRIYFHPIEGESGKYNVVLLEYVNLLKMAPSYVTSNKLPMVAKRTGFLNSINTKIVAYEASPGDQENTYELRPLVVVNDKIEVKQTAKPRLLTLSADASAVNPLAGATLTPAENGDPKSIFFPKEGDDKKTGIQYKIAKLTYEKAKLESTWRKNYLKGPYLAQYNNKDDVVLKLRDSNTAEFVINPQTAKTNPKKREKIFTNPKSAFLKGHFYATEPRDGMFIFKSVDAEESTKKIVEGRIGLFIDIFDATKSLNQDVVELCLIDSENPEDFLMYYEHPDNGEGSDPKHPR